MSDPRHKTSACHARSHAAGKRSLAVIHAAGLYRPVPPFACDGEGYPHDDSAPVENDYHDRLRAYLGSTMRTRYRDRDDVYAATDLGIYFEKGNRSAVIAPDLMVVFGASPHHRLSYKLWEEPKSRTSRRKSCRRPPGAGMSRSSPACTRISGCGSSGFWMCSASSPIR